MKVNVGKKGLGLFLGLVLSSGAALADPVVGAGSFSAAGSVNVSATTIDFGLISQPPPGDQTATINLPTTGAFSYLTATEQIGIANLNLSSATVTPSDINFDGSVPDWVSLPGGIDLSLTDIPLNTTVPVCSTLSNENAQGTLCIAYVGSPIVLEQGPSGVSALMNLDGNAYFTTSPSTLTPYSAKFSADFGGTISELLASFAATGSVTTGYSVTFTSTPLSAVPEPGTVTAFGVGLLLVGLINKKKRSAKRNM